MNDQLSSLTRIFTEQLYRIPDYQRGYAWTKKEVTEYWNDLVRLQPNKNHYVGVLTLEKVPSDQQNSWIDDLWLIRSKNFKCYYVVDGQQRLTTSILLIQSIINAMDKRGLKKLNYLSVEEISKRFIYDSKDENKSKSYIFCYEESNPSFEYLIKHVYNSDSSFCTQETVYTQNLDNALHFFTEQIEKLNNDELEFIFYKVTQGFLFNTYEIASDIDVFVTFETMNNRGKPLSNLELLKNRLIYISTLYDQGDDIKERIRRDINSCWKDIYYYLGKNKKRPIDDDEFLNAHFHIYFYKDSKRLVQTDMTNQATMRIGRENSYLLNKHFLAERVQSNSLKIEDIFENIESLKKSVALWNLLNSPESSQYSQEVKEYLKKLYYLTDYEFIGYYARNYIMGRVFILACLETDYTEKMLLTFLKTYERYIFISVLAYDGYGSIYQGNARIDYEEEISKIKKNEITLERVCEQLQKLTDNIIGNSEAKKNIKNRFSRQSYAANIDVLKYILCEYEMQLYNQSKAKTHKADFDIFYDDAYATIEHIYPKNARNLYWREKFGEFSQPERERIRDCIGNLLLVSKEKNGKLGNLSFPDKKDNKQNTACYRYGSFSEIEICENVDWNSTEVLKRGLKILNFMIGRWQFANLTTKKEKIDFIGLSFLLK